MGMDYIMPPMPPMPGAPIGGQDFLLFVGDHAFCRQEHSGNACCILRSNPCHFGWVDDSGCEEILKRISAGIVSIVAFALLDFLGQSRLPQHQRLPQSDAEVLRWPSDYGDTCVLIIIVALKFIEL